MKKIFFTICLMFIFNAFALVEYQDVGIAKYAVLETVKDYVPLREKPDDNSKRITHLPKGTVLFATKQTKNYFLVELDEENTYFVNKKFVEEQGVIPEKRFESVDKIDVVEKDDRYEIEITSKILPPYIIKEVDKNLVITFFDNHFDPTNLDIQNEIFNVELTQMIANEFKITYKNENMNNPYFGYNVLKSKNGYKIVIKKRPEYDMTRPLKDKKIAIDPGHGGMDSGACSFKLKEKKINLQISKKLRRELKRRGAKVYLTRKWDKDLGLYERVKYIQKKDADISLSIHQNSLANPKNVDKKHGVGVYYYHNQALPLATNIQNSLVEKTQFKDDKIHEASFVLTRMSLPVSVLVECGYIIHKDEAKKISDKNFQEVISRAIADGIENYLKENF